MKRLISIDFILKYQIGSVVWAEQLHSAAERFTDRAVFLSECSERCSHLSHRSLHRYPAVLGNKCLSACDTNKSSDDKVRSPSGSPRLARLPAEQASGWTQQADTKWWVRGEKGSEQPTPNALPRPACDRKRGLADIKTLLKCYYTTINCFFTWTSR